MVTFLRAMEPRGELSWRKVEEKRRREATASEEVASEELLRASCLSCVAEVARLARRRVESFLPVGEARGSYAGGAESLSRRAGVRAGRGGGGRATFLLASVAEMELSGKEAEETETLLRMAARDSDNIVRGHAETALQTLASRRPVVEVC